MKVYVVSMEDESVDGGLPVDGERTTIGVVQIPLGLEEEAKYNCQLLVRDNADWGGEPTDINFDSLLNGLYIKHSGHFFVTEHDLIYPSPRQAHSGEAQCNCHL